MIDARKALMLNQMLKSPSETLKQYKETKTSTGTEINKTIHDDTVSENKIAFKPGSEEIYHAPADVKMMRKLSGKGNLGADDLLKQKLEMKKSGVYSQLLKENTGMSIGAPIAPMNSESPSKNIVIKNSYISNAAKKKIQKIKRIKHG